MAYTGQEVLLRWDDSVYGPQKGAATGGLSDDQFYPDCGTMRNYPLENINYDLEKVIVPLLQQLAANQAAGGVQLTDIDDNQTATDTWTALGSQACKYVTVWVLSTASNPIEIRLNGGSSYFLEPGYSKVINTEDVSNIDIKQSTPGDVLYYTSTSVVTP